MQPGAAVLVKARDAPGLRSCSGGGQGSPGCLAQHVYPVRHPEQPAGESGGLAWPRQTWWQLLGSMHYCLHLSGHILLKVGGRQRALPRRSHLPWKTCRLSTLLSQETRAARGGRAGELQPSQAPMGWHQHVTRVCLDPSSRAPIYSLWCGFSRDRKFKGH